ncbi:MAG: c-type cytochrome [Candidatus Latescibacteria bacterium]|nr:c-type cytochrome [Candidatus Latescibacterota bacterium]
MLIREYGCLSCHKLDGIGASVGPILNGVRTRKTREEVITWIQDPKAIRPETKMPKFPFSEVEIRTIADYLMTK